MPGPCSVPNGDTRVVRGHIDEEFACEKHGQKELDRCENRRFDKNPCVVVPLRQYLAERNRLRTGKTK